MPSPIHHTFGPHIDQRFLGRILRISYRPWAYRHGKSVRHLRSALEERFKMPCSLFASGREALLAYLRGLQIRSGDEVIVQGYTCIVVPNAIHAAGATPVFADIDPETLNLTVQSVEAVLTPRTKVIICQHTFGIPADTAGLRTLCDQRGIMLIEDCAHVLPDSSGPRDITMHGDAVLLSFGRDKAISGIAGGAILIRNPDIATRVCEIETKAIDLPWARVSALLEYGPRMHSIVRPLIGLGLHRPFLWILNRIGLFAPILTDTERCGTMGPILHRIPNACAELALYSLKHLQQINDHRRQLTQFYLNHGLRSGWPLLGIHDDLPLQKFPLFAPDAATKRRALLKHNMDGPAASSARTASTPRAQGMSKERIHRPSALGSRSSRCRHIPR
jgi:perosamine synthetase